MCKLGILKVSLCGRMAEAHFKRNKEGDLVIRLMYQNEVRKSETERNGVVSDSSTNNHKYREGRNGDKFSPKRSESFGEWKGGGHLILSKPTRAELLKPSNSSNLPITTWMCNCADDSNNNFASQSHEKGCILLIYKNKPKQINNINKKKPKRTGE